MKFELRRKKETIDCDIWNYTNFVPADSLRGENRFLLFGETQISFMGSANFSQRNRSNFPSLRVGSQLSEPKRQNLKIQQISAISASSVSQRNLQTFSPLRVGAQSF